MTDSRKEEELVRRVSSKIIRILQRKTSRGRITKNELEQCILEINNRIFINLNDWFSYLFCYDVKS